MLLLASAVLVLTGMYFARDFFIPCIAGVLFSGGEFPYYQLAEGT